jgi:hypothetical protein
MEDRTAIIIAPGPSLDPSDIPAYHEIADVVVTVNRGFYAWKNYPNLKPDACFIMDGKSAFNDCLEDMVNALQEVRVYCPITNKKNKTQYRDRWLDAGMLNVAGVPFDDDAIPDKNPFDPKWDNMFCKPAKSLLFAWQFLCRTEGIRKIGIAGADLVVDPKDRYFFPWPKLTNDQHKVQFRSIGGCYECLKYWLPHAEAFGVQTVNLSGEKSRLKDLVESQSHGEFLKENENGRA